MYNKVKLCVRNGCDLSDFFDTRKGLKQGCVLCPILFSLFFEELQNTLSESELKGIQFSPDIIEILMLMFADDIALISDTVEGLQRQLNILCQHCNNWELTVHLDKSEIVVFRNGGKLNRHEHWTYGAKRIKVVSEYTYVGLLFSSQMSLRRMTENLASKSKRVLISMVNSMHSLGTLPTNLFF